jgi:hypothetical protein
MISRDTKWTELDPDEAALFLVGEAVGDCEHREEGVESTLYVERERDGSLLKIVHDSETCAVRFAMSEPRSALSSRLPR